MAITGIAVLDFGATPVIEASVAVIGQAGIVSTSFIEAFMQGSTTIDNDAEAHRLAGSSFQFYCDSIIDGVGFTIRAVSMIGEATGTFNVRWVWN